MKNDKFKENLVRLGDFISFEPFDGRRSQMKITRTRVEIFLQRGGAFRKEPCHLYFRGMSPSCKFELGRVEKNSESYFEFKSLNDVPFLHNGIPSFHSILRKNDRIDLEFNRLIFKTKENKLESNDLPIENWPKGMFINLEGETGTGKTTLARKFHEKFVGELLPFVHINLSAFSESLLESELFGHEKGAFTGATRERRGAIERASRGTLFMDEIDSLPLHLQVKLLTFLDNGIYQRVGGERFQKSQSRVVFASGRPLKALVKAGKLREDLYFRISSGFNLGLSSLRDTPEKINEILNSFELKNSVTISDELRDFYLKQMWPGNIRQLNSHLQRKMYEDLKCHYLRLGPSEIELFNDQIDLSWCRENILPLEDMKKNYCKSVLLKSSGSLDAAAKKLGIAKTTLKKIAC